MNFGDFSTDQMSLKGSGCWLELLRISVVSDLVVSVFMNSAEPLDA